MIIHIVEKGDTIESIATKYDILPEDIININFPPDPERLAVGQTLVILKPVVVHIVVEGDTIGSVANEYGKTPRQLLRNNPAVNADKLKQGQRIVISYDDVNPTNLIISNGFTYPEIDRQLLKRVLPYLSMLTIFTYGFNNEGELIEPDDIELINMAKKYKVMPVMLISTLSPNGTFSTEMATLLLDDAELQEVLINNIVNTMEEKGYMALNIDFEYLLPEYKDKFVAFVEHITFILNSRGFLTIVSLVPKTSSMQEGLLYESHDYEALGEAANMVLIMSYEWGYSFSEPMAVAPITGVEEVIKYGSSVILPQKILMGIPLYGYNWNIPYIEGSKATSLSPQEALKLASDTNSNIEFDQLVKTPYFYYTEDEQGHEVWFEDANSIDAKLDIIDRYNIAGAGYWNITREFPQNWIVLNCLFKVHDIL